MVGKFLVSDLPVSVSDLPEIKHPPHFILAIIKSKIANYECANREVHVHAAATSF